MENHSIAVIKAMFQRIVAYHPVITKATKSVKLTVLWGQIHYWTSKTNDPDGWVYKSHQDLFEETGLTRKAVDTARELGKKLGIIETVVKGTPPTVHYRIDEDRMVLLVSEYLKKHPQKERRRIKIEPDKKEVIASIDLPDWLDKKTWADWEKYRKEKKQKLTPTSIKRQLAFLEARKTDHIAIINTSITNGWTGLFELKKPLPPDWKIREETRRKYEEEERRVAQEAKQDPELAERIRLTRERIEWQKKGLLGKMNLVRK